VVVEALAVPAPPARATAAAALAPLAFCLFLCGGCIMLLSRPGAPKEEVRPAAMPTRTAVPPSHREEPVPILVQAPAVAEEATAKPKGKPRPSAPPKTSAEPEREFVGPPAPEQRIVVACTALELSRADAYLIQGLPVRVVGRALVRHFGEGRYQARFLSADRERTLLLAEFRSARSLAEEAQELRLDGLVRGRSAGTVYMIEARVAPEDDDARAIDIELALKVRAGAAAGPDARVTAWARGGRDASASASGGGSGGQAMASSPRSPQAAGGSTGGLHWVNGYTRKDGTQVHGYFRSSPGSGGGRRGR
jgi:hypothetical protein